MTDDGRSHVPIAWPPSLSNRLFRVHRPPRPNQTIINLSSMSSANNTIETDEYGKYRPNALVIFCAVTVQCAYVETTISAQFFLAFIQ